MALFQPGNQAAAGHGRPPKAKELATLDEIKTIFPPTRIVEILEEALLLAQQTRSSRGVLAVGQCLLDYTLGRPKPMEQESDAETVQALIALLQPRPAEPQAISTDCTEVVD